MSQEQEQEGLDYEGVKGVLTANGTVVYLGLPGPPIGPENSMLWYHEASQQLPPVRIEGWFGASIGSPESDSDVQLFLHSGDHMAPVIRAVIDQARLTEIFIALGKLMHERLGILAEWNVKQLEPNGAG